MANLYVTSWARGGGKTALCVGIGRHLQINNKRVGYLKPMALATKETSLGTDSDAQSVQQALDLKEPVDVLCPFHLTPEAIKNDLNGEELPNKLLQVYNKVAEDKDIVLLEGFGIENELLSASCRVADIMDAKVIMVVPYSVGLSRERIISSVEKFGQRLLGIVVNQVPQDNLLAACTNVTSLFSEGEIRVLGAIPEDRLLFGVSIAELVDNLQAETLCCSQALGEMVENLMIGALSVDSGVDYFSRKDNKAVITRGERPDIQLAALATSTKCLILSGGTAPIPQVLQLAEDKETPILLVKEDVPSIIPKIEETFLQAKLEQQKKLERLVQVLEQYFDFRALYQALGMAV